MARPAMTAGGRLFPSPPSQSERCRRRRAASRLLLGIALLAALAPGAVWAQTAQTVASDWALIPTGINAGDSFRLIFVTSTTRNAQSSNIADYNTFVQAGRTWATPPSAASAPSSGRWLRP